MGGNYVSSGCGTWKSTRKKDCKMIKGGKRKDKTQRGGGGGLYKKGGENSEITI